MNKATAPGFWSGRPVAVTGATGFLGHHVATQLAERGARVVALVRPTSRRRHLTHPFIRCAEFDLDDPASIARACRGCEVLFHVAGMVDFGGDWQHVHRVNVEGTRHVLAAARAAGVRRVVYTSSVVAVGAARRPLVLDESAAWNLENLRVAYITTKRRAEELALADPGLPEVVAVNPGCVVGPDDFSGSEFGTLARRFWRGKVPVHFGGGNNFVDVRDVADGHLRAAVHGRPGQRYILGGENRTFTAFFADLARVAPRPIFRVRIPAAVGTAAAALYDYLRRGRRSRPYVTAGHARVLPLFFYYDSAKARRELGYRARPLRETLADAYRFWMGRAAA
jgi:dihydroflavonol-4-reductase